MLTSEQQNLPSFWSFFNAANAHSVPVSLPPPHMSVPSSIHLNPPAGAGPGAIATNPHHPNPADYDFMDDFPQHIEFEFEDTIIRKNENPPIDPMRLKSSPDSCLNGYSEPSFCYLNTTTYQPLQTSNPPTHIPHALPPPPLSAPPEATLLPNSAGVPVPVPPENPPTCIAQVVSTAGTIGGGEIVPSTQASSGHMTSSDQSSITPVQMQFNGNDATTPPYQRCSPDTTCQIPSVSDYAGEYGFRMSYGSSSSNQAMSSGKGALWTFSEQTQKLYVKMAATCPIKFQTSEVVPPGCYLRALSVFKQPEHVKQVVTRCPNHAHGHSKDSFNEGHPAPSHLIRCEHPSAEYHEDPVNARQSVVVPFDSPQVGTDFVVFLFNFMCYGSCVGGLNRRPIQVVFTLEREGHILGRRAVEVRICACPSRDRKSEEQNLNPLTAPKRGEKRGSKALALREPCGAPSLAKRRMKGEDGSSFDNSDNPSDIFYVPVKGLYYYNLVTALYKQLCVHNGDASLFAEAFSANCSPDANSDLKQAALPAIDVTSGQEFEEGGECGGNSLALDDTPPVSPNTRAADMSQGTGTFTSDPLDPAARTSISDWLANIGYSHLIEKFISRNIFEVGQLSYLTEQDLRNMQIDDVTAVEIMKQHKEYMACMDRGSIYSLDGSNVPGSNLGGGGGGGGGNSTPPNPMMIVRTASNSSLTIMPNGEMRQTRFTLHHSVSFLKKSFEVVEEKKS